MGLGHERKFPVSKDVLDTSNSIFWFLLDACWMLGWIDLAIACVIPTVATGVCLVYIEKRLSVFFINCSILAWIVMNCLWMFSDIFKEEAFLTYSKMAFASGLVFVGFAAMFSKDLRDTFSHFRRFRGLKIP